MFKKIIKNSLLGFILLSYCSIALSMDRQAFTSAQAKQLLNKKLPKLALHSSDFFFNAQDDVEDILPSWITIDSWLINSLYGLRGIWLGSRVLSMIRGTACLGCPSVKDLACSEHPYLKRNASLIQNVFAKAGVSLDTAVKVEDAQVVTSPVSAEHNLLNICPALMDLFTKEEQEAIFAHECSHIKHKDNLTFHIATIASPFATYGILKGYQKVSDYLLRYFQRQCDRSSDWYSYWNTVRNINKMIANNAITHMLLCVFLVDKIKKYHENRADYEGVIALKSAAGVISAFKKMADPEFLAKYCAIAQIKDSSVSPDGMATASGYPTFAERIKAVEMAEKRLEK